MANSSEFPEFMFRPTDEHMILLLERRVKGMPIPPIYPILEKNLYDKDAAPWDVLKRDDPWAASELPNKKVIIVFSKLTFKSENTRNRVVRTSGRGTWDGKAVAHKIKNSRGQVIGQKRSFTFKPQKGFESEMDGKGRWIMHEYSLVARGNRENNSDYVICKISNDLPKGELFDKDETQVTPDDQVLSTDSTVSSATTNNTEMRRKRKSSSVNSDQDHQQPKKACSTTTEDQENQHTVPYFPTPDPANENPPNPSTWRPIPYLSDLRRQGFTNNRGDQLPEGDTEQVIPYSSQPFQCLAYIQPIIIQQPFFATPPWQQMETTRVDDIQKYMSRSSGAGT